MKNVQEKIGYTFKNVNLLETALTHSSYANECKKENNERLEFLGDSVLSVIISDYIFRRLPNVDEGWLSKYRATLVCEQSLNEISKKISLSKFILLGKGEEMTGGRQRASIVSDAFEAVLAAIYLDGGMETARKWVIDLMRDSINEVVTGHGYADYKTMLQEALQKGTQGIERLRATIRRILFNQRKGEIIRGHEEELYNRAAEAGEVKVFADEKAKKEKDK